jgi:hypothetical protein
MSTLSPPPEPPPSTPVAQAAAGLVPTIIRLSGVAVVMNEVFVEPVIRNGAVAVAAFMLAGAQGFDTLLDRLLGSR